MTGAEIREAFLKYFERNGHTRVPSSPLGPVGDQTLLFTNAGMVQFKGVFLGEERRDYARATTCQKCVRAGGKHNDLENVGRTARHHTFFEMLGNFSFGDYFKADAITFAWEFLIKDLGLDQRRLKATVFTDDDEAFNLWKSVAGLPEDRILRLGEEDNFWAMGDTGPCGPCSEVHFHQGDDLPCAEEAAGRTCLGPACECDRWLEIWNLVFMQFNRDASGKMTPLPRPSIDTGMGLERTAAVMQGKRSSYETDLFAPLIGHIARLSGKRYGAEREQDVSMQVIADHARATTFLIADGVLPANEWRGYVLRRIMRRAMRHGRKLGLTEPFLWRGVEWVGEVMGSAYPAIVSERDRIIEVVRQEEEQFAKTLDSGMRRIEEYTQAQGAGRGRPIDGRFLFTLYDTYGFPRDLAEEILVDQGWRVTGETEATWTQEMEAQRERARAKATFGADEDVTETVALYQQIGGALARPQQFVRDDRGHGGRRPPGARGGSRRRGGGHARSHAGLRGVGRPDGRHGHARRPRRAGRDPRHLLSRQQAHRAPREGAAGWPARGRRCRRLHRVAAPARAAPAPHGHAPVARGAPKAPRHPRVAGGLAGRARPPPLRLLPRRRRQGPRDRADRGARQRAGAGQHAGHPP